MDRKPEHLDDPKLRPEFVIQQSLDEFIADTAPWLYDPAVPAILAKEGFTLEDVIADIGHRWREVVSPQTNMTELLYLSGVTDRTKRLQILDQQHAELRAAALASGLLTEEELEAARKDKE
jgi:hypothetical protein